ncbi:hypothetical protein [Luteimonas sp. SDU101]|uniref:hypothetical protein n=1 Tax=Luteimonas sp. SDU101 TaxID=3422593 RepID=UPI003EBCE55F
MNGFVQCRLATCCLALGLASIASASGAPAPARFVDGAALEIAPGDWDGGFAFPGVYCLRFPVPEEARHRVSGLFNGTSTSLVRVEYDSGLEMSVVSSIMPAPLDSRQDHARQIESAREVDALLPEALYRFSVADSAMGPVMRRHLANAVSRMPSHLDPFPIAIAFHDMPAGQYRSIAELREFSRWPDRYEVAVYAPVPNPTSAPEIELMRQIAASFADGLMQSLQDCTGAFPARDPDAALP